MKVIMVPVSNRPESRVAMEVAAGLANRLGANIVGYHLRPHRDATKGYQTDGLPLFGCAKRSWLEEFDRKSTKSAAHQARQIFVEVAAKAGLKEVRTPPLGGEGTAHWQEKVGSPDRLMAILGPVADLTVITRPAANGRVARMFLMAALLHTGRPVLILPANAAKEPGRRIAIAWNQSSEASRVVAACMPLLQQAEQVTIVSCGPESRPGPKSSQLKSYLRYWGVDAKAIVTPGKKEEAELIDAYRKSRSDVLLMGAYSRSRVGEIVFGGMTEYVLSRTKIPVIMQHN
jgi:nucleotide-binding universal stress UspA family protein